MNITTPYGLIGRKLGHSDSPAIHAAFGNPEYALYPMEPQVLPEFLADTQLKGLNVTIPYKITVIPHCERLDPLAEAIGSVNTMVREADGTWTGYNTDAYGFRFLMRNAGLSFAGAKVLILGNGGASQTVQTLAKLDGAQSITVISRQGEHTYADLPQFADSTLIINATPVGMYPNAGQNLVDLRQFPQCKGVVDLIYNPCRTALLLQAEELGIPCSGGLPMLVAQAKQAEELFFDIQIPDEDITRVGQNLQQQNESIVLIGMPGCGKSTVGAALAEMTGKTAIDLDAEIERMAQKSIPTIFAEEGEAAFRALEHQAVLEQSQKRGVILMTGGGVVLDTANHAPLHSNGRIYWLRRELSLLPTDGRPLSQTNRLEEMAKIRTPLYAKLAQCSIENSGTPQQTAAAIMEEYNAYTHSQWTEPESAGPA